MQISFFKGKGLNCIDNSYNYHNALERNHKNILSCSLSILLVFYQWKSAIFTTIELQNLHQSTGTFFIFALGTGVGNLWTWAACNPSGLHGLSWCYSHLPLFSPINTHNVNFRFWSAPGAVIHFLGHRPTAPFDNPKHQFLKLLPSFQISWSHWLVWVIYSLRQVIGTQH